VGPTKGGVRFHPNVNESDINSLAIWMSLKAGIVDLPYGGAKGGIICDPREMSFRELEGLSRGYVRALNQIIGTHQDTLAPPTYTKSQIMARMKDENSYLNKRENQGIING